MYNPRQTSRLRQPINPRLPHDFNSNSNPNFIFNIIFTSKTPNPHHPPENGRTICSKSPRPTGPPKRRPNFPEELSKCDGSDSSRPTLVAIKGVVFDVTRNSMYGASGSYKVFAGKDASRALAKSSLKPEDCVPDWYDLPEKEKTVLDEWYQFFSKRYNIVGKVEGATNT
ncbi:Cytochrome b5 [Penicillium hetheringtonii]|uniref:Cytochrome b5 n=1 Tax=Penicillium hetheringtonii TaxID=911720 RepID=A0AAD6DEZ9_9EURO|nr:Cytochrome b5 [Penicillium hetheringtonii]